MTIVNGTSTREALGPSGAIKTANASSIQLTGRQLQAALFQQSAYRHTNSPDVTAGGSITLNWETASSYRVAVQGNAAITFEFKGPQFDTNGVTSIRDMLVELVNGGLGVLSFGPAINWIMPDGTTTTNLTTYLAALNRTALKTNGSDFFYIYTTTYLFGGNAPTIFGKLL